MDHRVMSNKPVHSTEEIETCKYSGFNNKFDRALTDKSPPDLKPQRS